MGYTVNFSAVVWFECSCSHIKRHEAFQYGEMKAFVGSTGKANTSSYTKSLLFLLINYG